MGFNVGTVVGDTDGDALGTLVGVPNVYDGKSVGFDVGAPEGDALGTGVCTPGL